MLKLPGKVNSVHLVFRNPQPATRNPQPATRNPQPATRNTSYTANTSPL